MERFTIPRSHVEKAAGFRRRVKPSDELKIDEQTFRDLEIFEAQAGPSLFEQFVRTRTTGGTKVLQARWRRPLSTVARITAVHDSIRHILAHEKAFNMLPGDSVVMSIEHYLYSGLPVAEGGNRVERFLQALEARVENFRSYWKMVTGVQRAAQLIRSLQAMVDNPDLQNAPGELGERLQRARELLDRPTFRTLPTDAVEEYPFWKLAPLDQRLRDVERVTIEELLRIVFEIDALLSMAIAVRDLHLVIPEVHDGPTTFEGLGIRHPFIEKPVPNPLRVDQEQRLLFVTGPNMAGKTTYLRACGVAIYLAHLGMGVPAKAFSFTPCDDMFSAIGLSDSIRAGISFFQAEALRLKAIAQSLADGRRIVALLDEPFMGTNVKDAHDASLGILSRLAEREGSVFIVSSHLVELGEPLEQTGNVGCWRFEALEKEDGLEFDYAIRRGISTQRLGVRVLRDQGVFALLDSPPAPPAPPAPAAPAAPAPPAETATGSPASG